MISLKAPETWKKKVFIPSPSGEPLVIEFEFKHMTRTGLLAFLKERDNPEGSDVDHVLAVACRWFDVDREMTREALTEFFEQYQAAPVAILATYINALTGSDHNPR